MTKNLSMKNSQFKTTADSENESWLIFDLESDGLYDHVSKIHCLVIYDLQSGNTFSYGPDAVDNANKLTLAIQKGSVTLRSEEQQYIYDYFCRAKTSEYNLSQNLTFWSGSDYTIRHNDMVTNPQVYISEVGLYDSQNSLLAVGRLSSPINKNFSSEAIVKVRLTY